MFTVKETFEPYRKGDLSLNEGDQVDRVKDIGHGWLFGRNVNTGKKGAFPEGCIDRETSVSGTSRSKLSKKSRFATTRETNKTLPSDEKQQQSEYGDQNYQNSLPEQRKSTENKSEQRATDLQYKVLESPENQHRSLKILVRVLCSLVAAGTIYLLLFYSFGFDIAKAGYIVIGMFIFLVLGFIFSSFLRCVILTMIPSLFTGRGKAIFLSVITGLLLSGPAMNILYNTEEVSESLGCTADLIYNQTRALRKQLEEPLRQLAAKLLYYMGNLRKVVTDVRQALQPVTDAMKSFSDTVDNAIGVVQTIANNCEYGITLANNKCKEGVASAKQTCEKFIDRYDPTNFIVEGVNIFIGLFGRRRRRDISNSTSVHVKPLRNKVSI
ncbi:hypothetical protein FSP39_005966 [Pinctada imbricata]|uniref:SH3 domain-containing protein n=1 Tax=Pinctada imbricata TaxID=66713 RepID=A0AA88YQ24_PINIB|nr:hypothetical protein FSP39_005966 [Pinctada imbricata]